jgi:hypothetical protein
VILKGILSLLRMPFFATSGTLPSLRPRAGSGVTSIIVSFSWTSNVRERE